MSVEKGKGFRTLIFSREPCPETRLTPRGLYAGLLGQLGLEPHFYSGNSKRLLQKEIESVCQEQKKKGRLSDLFWNKERLSANMKEEDAVTVAHALRELCMAGGQFRVWRIPGANGIVRKIHEASWRRRLEELLDAGNG